MMKRLVILPTYNEKENLRDLVERILGLDMTFDILVVDDNSPDGTGKIADDLAERHPTVQCLHRERKEGLGRAYMAAFAWALERDYQEIFHMDCDFSHDPERLPALARTLEKAHFAIGSRYVPGGGVRGWGLGRKVLSRWGSLYAGVLLGLSIRDLTGGFKGFRREVVEFLIRQGIGSVGYSFSIEMTYRAIQNGFRVREVPILFVDRLRGKSKMNLTIALEAAWRVPLLHFGTTGRRPSRTLRID